MPDNPWNFPSDLIEAIDAFRAEDAGRIGRSEAVQRVLRAWFQANNYLARSETGPDLGSLNDDDIPPDDLSGLAGAPRF